MNNKICCNCRHWDQVEGNSHLGLCSGMACLQTGPSAIILRTHESWKGEPQQDIRVATAENFGCINFESVAEGAATA